MGSGWTDCIEPKSLSHREREGAAESGGRVRVEISYLRRPSPLGATRLDPLPQGEGYFFPAAFAGTTFIVQSLLGWRYFTDSA
jgi:hypothetical protein